MIYPRTSPPLAYFSLPQIHFFLSDQQASIFVLKGYGFLLSAVYSASDFAKGEERSPNVYRPVQSSTETSLIVKRALRGKFQPSMATESPLWRVSAFNGSREPFVANFSLQWQQSPLWQFQPSMAAEHFVANFSLQWQQSHSWHYRALSERFSSEQSKGTAAKRNYNSSGQHSICIDREDASRLNGVIQGTPQEPSTYNFFRIKGCIDTPSRVNNRMLQNFNISLMLEEADL